MFTSVLADYTFGQGLLTVLEVFLFIAWIWVLISIFADLFGDHTVSGWGKAAWTLGLLLLPFLGAFIYLIARGGKMHERAAQRQAASRKEFETYVRQTAGASPAEELAKLVELRDRGAISEAEFAQMKKQVVSGEEAVVA